jgi:hypothetical protein
VVDNNTGGIGELEFFGNPRFDPCVCYSKDLKHLDKVETILGIFVDDGIVCSTNAEKLEDIPQYLDRVFKIRRSDMGYYIGLEVYQSQHTGITFLHQHRCIQHTFERFGMAESYSVNTPADPNVTLSFLPDESEKTKILRVPYKEAIGCLMFISLLTRPDITYVVIMRLNSVRTQEACTGQQLKGLCDTSTVP